jgi:hypothetical protein
MGVRRHTIGVVGNPRKGPVYGIACPEQVRARGLCESRNGGGADRRQMRPQDVGARNKSGHVGFVRVVNWGGADLREAEAVQAKRWNGRVRQRASGFFGNLPAAPLLCRVPAIRPASLGRGELLADPPA